MRRWAVILMGSLGLSVVPPGRADTVPPPRRFQAGVDIVRLNVSVTNRHDEYVTGLSDRDFALFEDGTRQALSFFARDPLPLTLSLLIDCSASMDQKLPTAQEAGVRFVQTLGTADFGRVVQFNDRVTTLQDFTDRQSALESALRQTAASGPTVLYDALYINVKELSARDSRNGPRRRAILLLSDGEDTASHVTDDQVLAQAGASDVAVYAIGLQPEKSDHHSERAAHFLSRIAGETGGHAYFPRRLSDLDGVYARIAEELRSQYTLGYVSANGSRDGRWRRIVVRTPEHDGLQVRYRLGYYAPRR
jgi:Ca-activated chloride channel homolog